MNFCKGLRLGLMLKNLEFCFKLSVSNIFFIPGYLLCMSACNLLWVFYHEPEVLKPIVPKCFTSFSDTCKRVVLEPLVSEQIAGTYSLNIIYKYKTEISCFT